MGPNAREDPGVSEDELEGRTRWKEGMATTAIEHVLDGVEADDEGERDEVGLHRLSSTGVIHSLDDTSTDYKERRRSRIRIVGSAGSQISVAIEECTTLTRPFVFNPFESAGRAGVSFNRPSCYLNARKIRV